MRVQRKKEKDDDNGVLFMMVWVELFQEEIGGCELLVGDLVDEGRPHRLYEGWWRERKTLKTLKRKRG
jgi:hypothetical protein